ncbi:hypothetical protein EZS27_039148 [termite gut metagenome]|uniref:Uncharacterized protein n=1 Tax=termite gut metagenome TaxID=433724 RepID=A0A5J4PLD3_9ZZZZ
MEKEINYSIIIPHKNIPDLLQYHLKFYSLQGRMFK